MTPIPKDPMILLSYVNMKLRDRHESLDAFCEDKEADKAEILAKLRSIDYEYDEKTNQFI